MNIKLSLRQILVFLVYSVIFSGFIYLAGYFLGIGFLGIGVAVIAFHLLQWWFSDRITLWLMGAKELKPGDRYYERLKSMVSELSKEARLPKPRIGLMDSDSLNAFATGPTQKRSVVCVTRGLMERLDGGEIKGVLGHELSHIKNRDVVTMMVAGLAAALVFYLSRMFLLSRRRGRGNPLIILSLIGFAVYFLLRLAVLAVSRYREYIADEGSARLLGTPRPLISGLRKISGQRTKMKNTGARKGLNYLFIHNPFSGKGIAELFSSHPPVEKRIKRLRSLKL